MSAGRTTPFAVDAMAAALAVLLRVIPAQGKCRRRKLDYVRDDVGRLDAGFDRLADNKRAPSDRVTRSVRPSTGPRRLANGASAPSAPRASK